MNDKINTNQRTIRIFAAGGGGTNIVYQLERLRSNTEPGFARIETAYIDTARSNVRADIPADSLYLVDGKDGSGGVRSENHMDINERIPEILQQFRPVDLNIIVGTLAGGSGSVIGPLIVKELLKRNQQVIVVGVGDVSSRIFARNTRNTIATYENFAAETGWPVVMHYLENSREFTRTVIDQKVGDLVVLLSALFSGQNRELDSQDLFNFLHFNNKKVTTFEPQLVTLHLVSGDAQVNDLGNIISVATLANDGQDVGLSITPDYHCTGYLSREFPAKLADRAPHHFVTADGIKPQILAALDELIASLDEQQGARRAVKSAVRPSDKVDTATGLVMD